MQKCPNSEKIVSRQKKIQTEKNNNNRPSSLRELEWYKLFRNRRNDPLQKLSRHHTAPLLPLISPLQLQLFGGCFLDVSSYVVSW